MPRRPPAFRPARPLTSTRDGGKAERDAFYSSARWMRLREAFLRANPLCADCEREATIAHHVVERLASPSLALEWGNLMPLCSPCHSKRHKARQGPPP